MYKKQMTCQKIVCFLCLVTAVILFLYSLGFVTDLYDALYPGVSTKVVENPDDPGENMFILDRERVPGARLYVDIQEFNQYLVKYAIVYIILAVLLFITNTGNRRKYYVSNYVSIGLFAAGSIYIPVFAARYISYYKQAFIDLITTQKEALLNLEKTYKAVYTESTLWFDLFYVVTGLMIASTVLLLACMVWKILLMKEERALVQNGKKVKA